MPQNNTVSIRANEDKAKEKKIKSLYENVYKYNFLARYIQKYKFDVIWLFIYLLILSAFLGALSKIHPFFLLHSIGCAQEKKMVSYQDLNKSILAI